MVACLFGGVIGLDCVMCLCVLILYMVVFGCVCADEVCVVCCVLVGFLLIWFCLVGFDESLAF